MDWQFYLIGRHALTARPVYAPTLLEAFNIARCRGLGSHTLTCFGVVR